MEDKIKNKLFDLVKDRVKNRSDVNSENRINKVSGLTGEKIFQKTYIKYTDNKTYNQSLHIVNNNLDKYFEWLDMYPIELLLASKSKTGYRKIKKYFIDGIFVESKTFESGGMTFNIRGTDFYLNKYK